MKNNFLFIAFFFISCDGYPQHQGGFEQLCVFKGKEILLMPIARMQNSNNWYMEARYNYEADRTFSLYAGRVFSKTAKISYEITPILGAVMGQFNGGSAGVNIAANLRNLFFSAQSQYTFSESERVDNFFYSWSELRYHPGDILFAGISLQQTYFCNKRYADIEPGIVAGFSFRNWSFPLYLFNPIGSSPYFVLAITWDWENK